MLKPWLRQSDQPGLRPFPALNVGRQGLFPTEFEGFRDANTMCIEISFSKRCVIRFTAAFWPRRPAKEGYSTRASMKQRTRCTASSSPTTTTHSWIGKPRESALSSNLWDFRCPSSMELSRIATSDSESPRAPSRSRERGSLTPRFGRQSLCRPRKERARVRRSAYSKSPPTGIPVASLVTSISFRSITRLT